MGKTCTQDLYTRPVHNKTHTQDLYTTNTCTQQDLYTTVTVADPGGGGSRGSGPSLLCHDVGFLTLGPKLDPRLAPPPFLLVDLIWTPLSKILDPPLLNKTCRLYTTRPVHIKTCTHQDLYTSRPVGPTNWDLYTSRSVQTETCTRDLYNIKICTQQDLYTKPVHNNLYSIPPLQPNCTQKKNGSQQERYT